MCVIAKQSGAYQVSRIIYVCANSQGRHRSHQLLTPPKGNSSLRKFACRLQDSLHVKVSYIYPVSFTGLHECRMLKSIKEMHFILCYGVPLFCPFHFTMFTSSVVHVTGRFYSEKFQRAKSHPPPTTPMPRGKKNQHINMTEKKGRNFIFLLIFVLSVQAVLYNFRIIFGKRYKMPLNDLKLNDQESKCCYTLTSKPKFSSMILLCE